MPVALKLTHGIPCADVPRLLKWRARTRRGRRVFIPQLTELKDSIITETEGGTEPLVNYQDHSVGDSKEDRLRQLFREMSSVLIAFSGGVDSTYVAYVANAELGDRALCVTGDSASLPQYQRDQTTRIVEQFGFRAETIKTDELDHAAYRANGPNRCYFCKDELYGKLEPLARAQNFEFIVDGSNTDDLGDYRPGRVAANEHRVRSPLIEVGMSKQEVRDFSRRAGLPTWDRPASPCLSSRIAYGIPVTIERLAEVDRGEEILRAMGFREFRVRHHDNLVRLEIAPVEMAQVLRPEVFSELARRFRELGFQYVTLDMQGYRSGAMNEVLTSSGNKQMIQ